MKTGALKNGERTLIGRVWVADRFWLRMKGLLGRNALDPDQALFLAPCGSVHTFFMRFPLDLLFVTRQMRVTRVVWHVPPFRLVFGEAGSWGVLEMRAGWLHRDAVRVGDEIGLA
ncbi:MAG: DUF192 domain-containing protein [Verrucomicrobiota bacterium]|nr:DUF192 domain-containing protein [Verrucomicrobiota bacterium]